MTEKSQSITVLRLGHRTGRDPRISTHLGLTARAFGADTFLLAGDYDSSLLSGIGDVAERFGGEFEVRHEESPLGFLQSCSGEQRCRVSFSRSVSTMSRWEISLIQRWPLWRHFSSATRAARLGQLSLRVESWRFTQQSVARTCAKVSTKSESPTQWVASAVTLHGE